MRTIVLGTVCLAVLVGCATASKTEFDIKSESYDSGILAILLKDSIAETELVLGREGKLYVNLTADCWNSVKGLVGSADWIKCYVTIESNPYIESDPGRVSESQSALVIIETEMSSADRLILMVSLYFGDMGIQYYRYSFCRRGDVWVLEEKEGLGAT